MDKGKGGNEETLNKWATETAAGEAHFRWGTSGDYARCVVFMLGKGLTDHEAHGHCRNLHVRATGAEPGHAPGEKFGGGSRKSS